MGAELTTHHDFCFFVALFGVMLVGLLHIFGNRLQSELQLLTLSAASQSCSMTDSGPALLGCRVYALVLLLLLQLLLVLLISDRDEIEPAIIAGERRSLCHRHHEESLPGITAELISICFPNKWSLR